MRSMATVIDRHHDTIVALWTEGVRRAAFAEGLTTPELSSIIPEYLSLLGGAAAGGQLSDQQHQLIEGHLSTRLRQGSVLNEILTEFAVLGRSVLLCLDVEPGGERPSIADITRLFAELSQTCVAVTRIFTEHMLEDEQTEKRYVRLLHEIGNESIASGHAMPVAAQMKAALAMILKAMSGQAVMLRLFDPESGSQILVESVGHGAAQLEHHDDASVSAALRAAGIHTVVDVALASRQLLRGTLRLGLARDQELSASEARRLQSLADALAVHLESVRLNAALRTHADAIADEATLRERFVSTLMHDLAGPLSSARTAARRLIDDRVHGAEAGAARIDGHLARVEEMVAGLVDAHRIRAGHRLPMTIAECDLVALARSVIDELREVHGDRFLLRGDGHVRGMWSADQLRRAIANLVENAVQHGAEGGTVAITTARREAGAEISVHNHGPELGRDERARLVEPFSPRRAGGATPRGWGLGLTLVWGCAEAHGGRVEIDGGPGEGTTFKLTLPFDARPYGDAD